MLKHNKGMIKALESKKIGTKEWKDAFLKETQIISLEKGV